MIRSRVLLIALAFASFVVLFGSAIAAVWLTEEVRVVGLILLPASVVASLLVLYFEWRAGLRRRLVADVDDLIDWDQAA